MMGDAESEDFCVRRGNSFGSEWGGLTNVSSSSSSSPPGLFAIVDCYILVSCVESYIGLTFCPALIIYDSVGVV